VGRRGKGRIIIVLIGNARVEERLGNYCLVRMEKQKHNWKGERRSRVGFSRIHMLPHNGTTINVYQIY